MNNEIYRCPLCFERLTLTDSSGYCDNNHSFDRAKLGYFNLLPVQNKGSKEPGDSKEMLQARRTFLMAGHYQLLSDRINAIANEIVGTHDSNDDRLIRCLDLGCGEGYYLERLMASLSLNCSVPAESEQQESQLNNRESLGYGIDISKEGIILASKRKNASALPIEYSVSSCSNLPFINESFDLIVRVFSPSEPLEMKRVLKREGRLITVSPGPRHHFQLKELIYDQPHLHPQKDQIDGLTLSHSELLAYSLELTDPSAIDAFLQMTPYAWKLTAIQKEKLINSPFSCEIEFKINQYN